MIELILKSIGWLARRFMWLLVVTVILACGYLLVQQVKRMDEDKRDLDSALREFPGIEQEIERLASRIEGQVNSIRMASADAIGRLASDLRTDIDNKSIDLIKLSGSLTSIRPDRLIYAGRLRTEIALNRLALTHVEALKAHVDGPINTAARCEQIRLNHVAVYRRWGERRDQARIHEAQLTWIDQINPLSSQRRQLKRVESERDAAAEESNRVKREHDQCLAHLRGLESELEAIRKTLFAFDPGRKVEHVREIKQEIDRRKEQLDQNLIKKAIIDPVRKVLPAALSIVALLIAVPVAIRAFLYFVLAPLASRRASICLVPHARPPSSERLGAASSVSLSLPLMRGNELRIAPQYLLSASGQTEIDTKFGFTGVDRLTRVAAGLVNLTRVTAIGAATVELSAGEEMHAELAVVEVGDSEAIALLGSNVVGFAQDPSSPMRISSHWRLSSLHSWLTLQLRFLVFHGPARIVVRGGRGVRILDASIGQSFDQSLTIGFSANLRYSTQRVETFWAYFFGKKRLVQDRFGGSEGIVLREEMPTRGKGRLVGGNWIEGVGDALLKVVGV